MLTEEAHHMFVGESGVARIIQRTCDVMRQHSLEDPADGRQFGLIDLATIQKFLNFHYSVTLDLYGSDVSSNAATYYTSGLKGRYDETKLSGDHKLGAEDYPVGEVENGGIVTRRIPALNALNARLRDDYVGEIQAGVDRWNRIPEKFGMKFPFVLPHLGFHRKIGNFAGQHVTPDGQVVAEDQWKSRAGEWLPVKADHDYVESLMGRVIEPGKFANWIAPPVRGVNNQPIDFQYVRFN
jgi:benzoyl-CoA 2,3-dioxygenase component B